MTNMSAAVRLLVVDDEPFNLEIIGEYLDGQGYELTMARDGVNAWQKLDDPANDFDLLVLDRMMPRLDGMELLRRVRRTPRLSGLPVIMQTAAATPTRSATACRPVPATTSPNPTNRMPCSPSSSRRWRTCAATARSRSAATASAAR